MNFHRWRMRTAHPKTRRRPRDTTYLIFITAGRGRLVPSLSAKMVPLSPLFQGEHLLLCFLFTVVNVSGRLMQMFGSVMSFMCVSSATGCDWKTGLFYASALMRRICFTDVFCFFAFCFLLFPSATKIPDNRFRKRLNGFSWNFYQTIAGKMEFALPYPNGG